MSGHRVDPDRASGFDYLTKADGQHVHCERAAFIAPSGIPSGAFERITLGIWLGVGFATGISGVLLGGTLIRAAAKLLFA